MRIEGISDPGFTHAYLSAAAVLDELNGLSAAVRHIPLAMPVNAAAFDNTSGFGARVDPFTGRYAFHPGIDFAGPWGSPVQATAPGTVVFAGAQRRLWQSWWKSTMATGFIHAMVTFRPLPCGSA